MTSIIIIFCLVMALCAWVIVSNWVVARRDQTAWERKLLNASLSNNPVGQPSSINDWSISSAQIQPLHIADLPATAF